MNRSDKIRALLGAHPAGMTLAELSNVIDQPADKTSGLLGYLRKAGQVRSEGGYWKLASAPPTPAPGVTWSSVETVQPVTPEPAAPETEPAEKSVRFWVYSDRTVGIAHGETSIELNPSELEQLVAFLAGVRPLLQLEPA